MILTYAPSVAVLETGASVEGVLLAMAEDAIEMGAGSTTLDAKTHGDVILAALHTWLPGLVIITTPLFVPVPIERWEAALKFAQHRAK